MCFDADFLPFGYEKDVTTTCTQNYKFEGKERDTETNNDDFGARYYSSQYGRWLSADWSSVPAPVPYANLTNPQTLNLYTMVSDNPESFADLDGHCGHLIMPGAASATEPCENPGANTHDDVGDGNSGINFDENTGIPDWYRAEVSAASSQYAAQQAAKQNSKPKPKPKQKLTFNTMAGGEGSRNWIIQWQLSQKSRKGGWIVQQITWKDSKGKQIGEYWEAWQVQANSQVTTYHGIGTGADDIFGAGILSHMTIDASARFYEGLELPDSFVTNNPNTTAGQLRSTTTDPHLPANNATDPVDRTWTSPW